MEDDKRLSFLQNLTHMALTHAASVPNQPTAKGGMSHDKMMSFVNQIAQKGLQHFATGGLSSGPMISARPSAAGGSALGGPQTAGVAAPQTTTQGLLPSMNNPGQSATSLINPLNYFNGKNEAIGMADIKSLIGGTQNQFQASAAPIQEGTNAAQLNNAYSLGQAGLATQGQLAGTLNQGLNQGVGNQSQLAQMYLNQANGQGPNPALAQLNQTTGNNIAQQAALMAGQRGGGANAGLLARQAGQQGAATQQQAVGQAATQSAQQQLAAEGNLQNLSANQIAQGTSATQGLNNAAQNEQSILQGANTAYNNANVSQQSNINTVNAGVSSGNQQASNKGIGGIIGGIASAFLAEGGEVKKEERPWIVAHRNMMASGGTIQGQQTAPPQSYVGNWLNSSPENSAITMSGGFTPQLGNTNQGDNGISQGVSIAKKLGSSDSSGAMTDTMMTAGGGDAISGASSGGIGDALGTMFAAEGGLMKSGGKVDAPAPGEKAKVKGDSYSNDKIPAMLSEGEVVIDRNTMQDPGPMGQMARALAKHIEAKKKGGKK